MEELVVDGKRLEVARCDGDRGRPTLVLLHEGLGSVSAWRDFPAALARATGCPALVYSRLGYGRSDAVTAPRPVTFMHHEAEVVLPSLLERASVDEAILVGHSDGGSIALLYAARPEARSRVRGLILEAPHVFVEDSGLQAIAALRPLFATGDLRARLARHHADVDGAFGRWIDVWLAPAFRGWNIEGALPSVRAPALLLQGEQDEYGTLAQLEAIRAQLGAPCRTVVLSHCGHSPHRDQPERTLREMARFVDDLHEERAVSP